jgi:hypothetical protein
VRSGLEMHIFDSNGIFVQLHHRHEYISMCRLQNFNSVTDFAARHGELEGECSAVTRVGFA